MEKLIENIKSLRRKSGKSQAKLSKEIGVDRQIYCNWEAGRTKPKVCDVVKLSKHYQISVGDLLGGTVWLDPSQRPEKPESGRLRIWIYCETDKSITSGEGTFKNGKYYLDGKDVTRDVKKWQPIPMNPGTTL